MKKSTLMIAGVSLALAGCATMYSAAEYEKMAKEAVERSFVEKGIAKKDRINQDAINAACSAAEMNKAPLAGDINRKLEQAEFQSVVSGEDIQVNVKHQKAFSTTWTVPGALAGNEVPSWADASGSVQRRVVLFEFVRAVTNGDMKLGDKLMAEMPAILAKCNKAYLEMAGQYSHVNIWTVLPEYFKITRDQLAQSVNSVEAFLASTEVIRRDDLFCPMADFRTALKSFEMSNNYKSKKYDADFFRGPFTKLGLRVERCKRRYRGSTRQCDFVMGVDLNDVQEEDDDL